MNGYGPAVIVVLCLFLHLSLILLTENAIEVLFAFLLILTPNRNDGQIGSKEKHLGR